MKDNKLKIFGLVCVLAGAVLVTRTPGQSQVSSPNSCCVGVIDFVRIFNECAEIKDLNERIRQKETEVQAEASERKKKIADAKVTLSAFTPGTKDHEQRRKELMRMNVEANVWFEMSKQDLEMQRFDWTRIIYEKSLKIAGEIARERGYDMVLQYKEFKPDIIEQTVTGIRRMIQDRAVIYAASELDITDSVIRRLDERYRTSGGIRPSSSSLSPSGKMTPTP